MRIYLLLILFFGVLTVLPAQKFLQIEKPGKMKVRKIPVGGHFYFQLADEKQWYEGTIQEIYASGNTIQFENYSINIKDITAIKFSKRNGHWARSLSNKLYIFAGSWIGFSLLGALAEEPLNETLYTVPAGAVGLGTLIRLVFRPKVFRIGKNRRLRLLDLSFAPVFDSP